MEPALAAALVSAVITLVGVGFAYAQWRRDVQIRLEGFQEQVAVELVRRRVDVYKEFFPRIEPLSTVHRKEIESDPRLALEFAQVFQDGIYGSLGLLASSDTREILVYARQGCKLYAERVIASNFVR